MSIPLNKHCPWLEAAPPKCNSYMFRWERTRSLTKRSLAATSQWKRTSLRVWKQGYIPQQRKIWDRLCLQSLRNLFHEKMSQWKSGFAWKASFSGSSQSFGLVLYSSLSNVINGECQYSQPSLLPSTPWFVQVASGMVERILPRSSGCPPSTILWERFDREVNGKFHCYLRHHQQKKLRKHHLLDGAFIYSLTFV